VRCSSYRTTSGPSRAESATRLRTPSIAHRAIGYRVCRASESDGNDVLAFYAVVAEAANRAQVEGGGPTAQSKPYLPDGPTPRPKLPRWVPVADEVDPWYGPHPIGEPHLLPDAGVWTDGSRNASRQVESGCDPNCGDPSWVPTTFRRRRDVRHVYHDITPGWCDSARNF